MLKSAEPERHDQHGGDRRDNEVVAQLLPHIDLTVGGADPERLVAQLLVGAVPEITLGDLLIRNVFRGLRDLEPELDRVAELQHGVHRQHGLADAEGVEEGPVAAVQVLDMPLPADRRDLYVCPADTRIGDRDVAVRIPAYRERLGKCLRMLDIIVPPGDMNGTCISPERVRNDGLVNPGFIAVCFFAPTHHV